MLVRYDEHFNPYSVFVYTLDGEPLCEAKDRDHYRIASGLHPVARILGTPEQQEELRAGIELKQGLEKNSSALMRGMLQAVVLPETQARMAALETETAAMLPEKPKTAKVIRLPALKATPEEEAALEEAKAQARAEMDAAPSYTPSDLMRWKDSQERYAYVFGVKFEQGLKLVPADQAWMEDYEETPEFERYLKNRYAALRETIVPADRIVVTGGGHTRILFPAPVALAASTEYALVILCDNADTEVAIAELGKFDTAKQQWVASQPYTIGVLLSSSNASTWTAHQSRDLTFRLLEAVFAEGTNTIDLGAAEVSTPATDLILLSLAETPTSQTRVEYELGLPSGENLTVAENQPVRLALFTGMRRGALLNLQWNDLDFERGFITLRGDAAKKQKTETIPMNDQARAILNGLPQTKSPYVFPGRYDDKPRGNI